MLDNRETSTKYVILFVENTNLKGGINMLKFQNNNITIIKIFEDFIFTAYVVINDSYYQIILPNLPLDAYSG